MSDAHGRYTVIIHDNAANMLYAHVRFMAKVDVSAASKLRDALHNAISSLEEMPFRCPTYRTHKTSDCYHQLIIGRYKIIFAINHKDKVVSIRYVLDSRQANDL